jgi:hypothetical protein
MTQAFRLRAINEQGTAVSLPETWTHYPSVEVARAGAKLMYHPRSRPARHNGDRQRGIVCRLDRAMTAVRSQSTSGHEWLCMRSLVSADS